MGTKDLKNRVAVSTTVKTDLHEWVKQYSQETSIPISKLMDKAIELLKESTEK